MVRGFGKRYALLIGVHEYYLIEFKERGCVIVLVLKQGSRYIALVKSLVDKASVELLSLCEI